MLKIVKTPWYSYSTGKIPKGCELCVQGKKMVLFITGICVQKCFYCPISEKKYGCDVVFANEFKIKDAKNPIEMFEESKLTEAEGAGITGGDPLINVERCCNYIKRLKKSYGTNFHIHLYTPLKLVSDEKLKKLYEAGLDEIRFHPNLDDESLWRRIELASKYDWDIGIEIPVIPGYEKKIKKMIDFVSGKVQFINLNELELSDTSSKHYKLSDMGFKTKNKNSYAVKGSEELGKKILEYTSKKSLNGHLCTAKLKDSIQVTRRLTIRAKNMALPFDTKTEDGTLIRGCVYLKELTPCFSYREVLKKIDKNDFVKKLLKIKEELIKKLSVSKEDIVVDKVKFRLLMPSKLVQKNSSKIKKRGLVPAIVEETPTEDSLEIEVEFV